jgi:CRISPR-associated protein Csa2
MGFISIAARTIMNLESLSGVETVGNLARHRTAPVVLPQADGFAVRFLPVLSGESLAHAYQELLVEEANNRGLPLSERSRRGEFLKFADDELLKQEGLEPPKKEEDIRRTEVRILLKDYVSDVGGFLYAGEIPVKRTSCFQVGYAIPAIWEREAAALESQFHVRFAPSDPEKYQIPYNVEVGSAIYTFTFNLELDRIGRPSTKFGDVDQDEEAQLERSRAERVRGALSALVKFYSHLPFGAKRSRFLPNMEPLSIVASFSRGVKFVVSPGNERSFVSATTKRSDNLAEALERLGAGRPDIKIFVYDKEGAAKGLSVATYSTPEEALKILSEEALREVQR